MDKIFLLSESEFPELLNFQNEFVDVIEFIMLINSVNSDSDNLV